MFHPLAQKPCTGSCGGLIENSKQRTALFLGTHRFCQLKIASRVQVYLHILTVFVYIELFYIRNIGFLCFGYVIKQCTERADESPAFDVALTQCIRKLLYSRLFCGCIVVLFRFAAVQHGAETRLYKIGKLGAKLRCHVHQHLARRVCAELAEKRRQILCVVEGRSKYLRRRNVRKANSGAALVNKNGRKIVISCFGQHGCLGDRSGRDYPYNVALDQSLSGGGILHLLTYCDLISLFYKSGNI